MSKHLFVSFVILFFFWIGVNTAQAVTPIAGAVDPQISTAENPVWYTVMSSHTVTDRANRFLAWDGTSLSSEQFNSGIPEDQISDKYLWRLEKGSTDDKIYFVNRGSNLRLQVPEGTLSGLNTSLEMNAQGTEWVMKLGRDAGHSQSSSCTDKQYCFNSGSLNDPLFLNVGDVGVNYVITVYNAGIHAASGWFFYAANIQETVNYAVNFSVNPVAGGSLAIANNGTAVTTGTEVEAGATLTGTITYNAKYNLKSLTINGEDKTSTVQNGVFTFTVDAATTIVVELEKEEVVIESNKAITIPQATFPSYGNGKGYRLQIAESILGDRNDGATDRNGKSFTVSSWVNMDKITNSGNNKGNVIMGHGPQAHMNYNGSLVLAVDENGKLKIISGASNSINKVLDTNVELNTWAYLTLIYDNDNQKVLVYKNGVLAGEANLPGQLVLFGDDPTIFFVGGCGFSGLCDEFQFFNKALTADEVQQAYADPKAMQSLTAWYDFNSIAPGTTGSFSNKATAGNNADVKAVFYEYTGGGSSDGGLVSGNVSEFAPTLTDGRVITIPAVKYTVTYTSPEGATVEVYNGDNLIATATEVEEGTELTVKVTVTDGTKVIDAVKANDTVLTADGDGNYKFTLTAATNVEVTLRDAVNQFTITLPEMVINGSLTVMNGENALVAGPNVLAEGTELTITATPDAGYLLDYLKAGEVEIAEGVYAVTADAEITVNFVKGFTVTLETNEFGTIEFYSADEQTKYESGVVLPAADNIKYVLVLTPNQNCELVSILANGKEWKEYVADNKIQGVGIGADSHFKAEFKEIEVVEGAPKAIHVPASSGSTKYQFRFDDIVLGEHTNGTNNEWNNGIEDKGDHRARNFTMSVWVKALNTDGQLFGHGQAPYYNAGGTFGITVNSSNKLVLKGRTWLTGGSCDGITDVVTAETLNTGEWAFLTVAVDDAARTIKLYKNGTLIGTGDLSKTAAGVEGHGIGLLQDECVFFVGNGSSSCDVDEIQVWNKTLTDSEIAASMGGYSASPENLVAFYKFDENSIENIPNQGSGVACNSGLVSGTIQWQGSPYWADVYTCAPIQATLVDGHVLPKFEVNYEKTVVGGTIQLMNGDNVVEPGDKVNQHTVLTVVTTPENGYKVRNIKVNDVEIEGNTFAIAEVSTVTVEFTNKLTLHYSVSEGGTMIVHDGINEYNDGDEFDKGLSLMVAQITPAEGYEVSTFTVNGEDQKAELNESSGSWFRRLHDLTEDVTLAVTFAKKTFKVTYNTPASGIGTLTVKDGSANVESDSSVDYGTELTVTVKASDAATLTSFTVNGVERMNDLANNVLKITVDQELALNATFVVEEYSLSWTISGAGAIAAYDSDNGDAEITQDGKVMKGHWVRMDITPDAENELTGLKLNDEVISLKDNENLEFADDHYEYWFEMTSDNKVSVTFQPVSSVGNTSIDGISVVYRSGMLYVNGMVEGDQIDIYDIAGNYVRTSELAETSVSDLTDGCYLVKVSTANGSKTVKFIK